MFERTICVVFGSSTSFLFERTICVVGSSTSFLFERTICVAFAGIVRSSRFFLFECTI